jgi:hypothetical protein
LPTLGSPTIPTVIASLSCRNTNNKTQPKRENKAQQKKTLYAHVNGYSTTGALKVWDTEAQEARNRSRETTRIKPSQ